MGGVCENAMEAQPSLLVEVTIERAERTIASERAPLLKLFCRAIPNELSA